MMTGRSVFHVNQVKGELFKPGEICGYFNSMIEKVTMQPEFLEKGKLPSYNNAKGETVFFPVSIIQYALGCNDLFLREKDNRYLDKMIECSDWIIGIQNHDGSIPNFVDDKPDHPFGAMCQGEAVSLLLRTHKFTNDPKYLEAARLAVQFMVIDYRYGGTSQIDDGIYLLEFTDSKPVLNGWIFSLFGLYDYVLFSNDAFYKSFLNKTIETLKKSLPLFDCGYWSLYDLGKRFTSPFYHKLHIAQLDALYDATSDEVFLFYKKKWEKYFNNPFFKITAFFKKAIQKIKE